MKSICKKSVIFLMLLIFGGCSEGDGGHQEKMNDLRSESEAVAKSQQPQQMSPEQVLMKYLDAIFKSGRMSGKSQETYSLISQKDKNVIPEDEYLSEGSSSDTDVSKELMSVYMKKISYEIKSSVVEDAKATIEVGRSDPQLPDALLEVFMGNNNPELEREAISYLQSQDLQFYKFTETYELVREQEGWRVFLDLATTKKVDSLINEAKELAPSIEMLSQIDGSELESMKPNLLMAEKKYKEALSLGESFIATNDLEYLEKQIKKLRFYEQHKGQVQIRNVQVGSSIYGEKGVFGDVKNNSDVTFAKVKITIYFLDKNGIPVHEKSYHPVYVTKGSHGDDAIPLKPNYSRKFGVTADDAPHDWSDKVEIILSDLEAE